MTLGGRSWWRGMKGDRQLKEEEWGDWQRDPEGEEEPPASKLEDLNPLANHSHLRRKSL